MVNPDSVLTTEISDYKKRLKRFLTAGNAGGAIATLGLMGTAIGASDAGTAPRPMFLVLVIFLTGLLGMWFALSAEGLQWSMIIRKRTYANERSADGHDWSDEDRQGYKAFDRRYDIFTKIEFAALSIGSGGLIFGAIFGLMQLWRLTG